MFWGVTWNVGLACRIRYARKLALFLSVDQAHFLVRPARLQAPPLSVCPLAPRAIPISKIPILLSVKVRETVSHQSTRKWGQVLPSQRKLTSLRPKSSLGMHLTKKSELVYALAIDNDVLRCFWVSHILPTLGLTNSKMQTDS